MHPTRTLLSLFIGFCIIAPWSCTKETSQVEITKKKVTRPYKTQIFANLSEKVPRNSKYVRPKSTELLALLEAGQIDYVFSYRNIAVQQGLQFLEFPQEINLGSERQRKFYRRAAVRLTDGTIKRGMPIQYGLTIPLHSEHPELALEFTKMILSPEGQDIMQDQGQPAVTPPITGQLEKLPEGLKGFFTEPQELPKPQSVTVKSKTKFHIFHAGSLTGAFREFEKVFEKRFPKVDVINEPHGSRTAIRQVTEMGRAGDLIGSADYTVIEELMFPNFADWQAIFTKNEMVLIYSEHSKYANEINQDNWYKVLTGNDVHFGRSDPDQDPSGYRAELLWKLADLYYTRQNRLALQQANSKKTPATATNVTSDKKYVVQVLVNNQLHKGLTKEDLEAMSTRNFKLKNNPVNKGVLFEDFFKNIALEMDADDEIYVEGKGRAAFSFEKAQKEGIGFVLTRKGTPKIVGDSGAFSNQSSWVAHVRRIEVTKD